MKTGAPVLRAYASFFYVYISIPILRSTKTTRFNKSNCGIPFGFSCIGVPLRKCPIIRNYLFISLVTSHKTNELTRCSSRTGSLLHHSLHTVFVSGCIRSARPKAAKSSEKHSLKYMCTSP